MIVCSGPGIIKPFVHFSEISEKSHLLTIKWKAFFYLHVWSCLLHISLVSGKFVFSSQSAYHFSDWREYLNLGLSRRECLELFLLPW